VRARESALALERAAPPEALQSAAHRSFWRGPGLDFARHLRKPATLAISTAHATSISTTTTWASTKGPPRAAGEGIRGAGVALDHLHVRGAARRGRNGKLLVLLTHELGSG